jgi:malate permease and related proteins
MIPFLYILLGYAISSIWDNATKYISFVLINILIPSVVFITILTYNGNIIHIVLISYLFSLIIYFISKLLFKKNANAKILQICIYSLNSLSNNLHISPLKRLLTAPPFLAFILGISLKFIIGTVQLQDIYLNIYLVDKIIMSIFGMGILGIWLQKSPIKKEHWKEYFTFGLIRLCIGFLVSLILLGLSFWIGLISKQEIQQLLLIPLLPVAANIVVLETYYLKSAKSTHVISVNTIFSLFLLVILGLYIQY